MVETLQNKILRIHNDYVISGDSLSLTQSGVERWSRYSELAAMLQVGVLRGISVEEGVEPIRIINTYIIDPRLVVVDEKVPELCWSEYLRPDGRLLACGGVRHKRSACPPYAPKPAKTKELLSNSQAVVIIQAHDLVEYDNQKQLHRTLLAIEQHLVNGGFNIVGSWAAGPCRICEPENDCLSEGKCRQPKLRRFSMEGSGIAVFLTCGRIAELTRNDSWRLELIRNWELPNAVN